MDITVPKTKIDYCIWIIGGLLFLSALIKIKLLLGIVNFQQLWAQALIIILFGSVVSGFIGICFRKTWGFFFLYIYILVATFFFSISVIPFLYSVLNLSGKTATTFLIFINLTMLLFTVILHAAKWRETTRLKEKS